MSQTCIWPRKLNIYIWLRIFLMHCFPICSNADLLLLFLYNVKALAMTRVKRNCTEHFRKCIEKYQQVQVDQASAGALNADTPIIE